MDTQTTLKETHVVLQRQLCLPPDTSPLAELASLRFKSLIPASQSCALPTFWMKDNLQMFRITFGKIYYKNVHHQI